MLAVSGELDPAIGGPSRGHRAAAADDRHPGRSATRRDALLDAFDAPDGIAPRRAANTTTTATQALLLINGDWTLGRARALAARLERFDAGSRRCRRRIALAYRLAFGAPPEPGRDRGGRGVPRPPGQAAVSGIAASNTAADHDGARRLLPCALNRNEFLYVD